MKFVLAGFQADYERFIRKLWSKDKDVSDYRYISHPDFVRGYSPTNNEIIKLGSFRHNPDREEILREVETRGFNMNPRSERMRGLETGNASFGEGGIVSGITSSSSFYDEHTSGLGSQLSLAAMHEARRIAGSYITPRTGYNMELPRGTTVRITGND